MLRKSNFINKRQAREAALQFLYQTEFDATSTDELDWQNFTNHINNTSPTVRQLVQGVLKNKKAIDQLLAQHCQHWSLPRMSQVDRNVLRLAVFEMKFGNTPPKVAIDEALEVVRKYGDTQSAPFVNGVLDAILKNKVLNNK